MPVFMNGEGMRDTNSSSPFPWRRTHDGRADVTEGYSRILNVLTNIYTARENLLRRLLDPRRDIDAECGYPRTEEMTPQHYKQLYDRNPYARRAVEVWPKEASQSQGYIYEKESTSVQTVFEKAFREIGKALSGNGRSHFSQDKNNPFWDYVLRADIQSRIGGYGIILIGVKDDKDLCYPVDGVMTMPDSTGYGSIRQGYGVRPVVTTPTPLLPPIEVDENGQPIEAEDKETSKDDGEVTEEKGEGVQETEDTDSSESQGKGKVGPNGEWIPRYPLTFLRVFPQSSVRILQRETNTDNPRFGQPIEYEITFVDPTQHQEGQQVTAGVTRKVHWTRVIHIVPCKESNEVEGTPFLQPILDCCMDLHKVSGSSAEMYYKGAFAGMSLETVPQLGGDVVIEEDKLKEMIELYQNGLQRYLLLMGMSAKSLAPQVSDPKPQIDVQIEKMCVYLTMPTRVYKGSERGEMSSAQDSVEWNDRVKEYNSNYKTYSIIIPLIDRFIDIGFLPVPEEGWKIFWTDLSTQSRKDKADVGLVLTQALAAYVGGNLESVVTLVDFLTRFLGFEEEEAYAMLDSVLKQLPTDIPAPTSETEETVTLPDESQQGTETEQTPPPTVPIAASRHTLNQLAERLDSLGKEIISALESLVSKA